MKKGTLSTPPFANTAGDSVAAPTESEMENAVKGLDGASSDQEVADGDVGDDDDEDDDHWGVLIGRTTRGPRYLNAFDLVCQCGGFMLDRIFSPQMLRSLQGADENSATSAAEAMLSSGAVRFGSAGRRRGTFNFTSPVVPAEELMRAVYGALQEMKFEFHCSLQAAMSSGRVRATLMTAKGMVGLSCQVFVLCSTLSLLEVRRGKGDLLEWNHAFSELTGSKRIGHLLNMPPADGEAKSESAHHS
jgi:hypothetical protein